MSRSLALKAWTQRKTGEWKDAIQKMVTGDPGRQRRREREREAFRLQNPVS